MAKITKSVNESNRSLSRYLEEIGKYEPLHPDREVELAQQIKKNDRRALKELVQANLRFVVSVAKDYQGQGLPLTDLINEGNLGLIKAAGRFDETSKKQRSQFPNRNPQPSYGVLLGTRVAAMASH